MTSETATLEVIDLKAAYGVVPALHGVNLRVMHGQVVTLIGANGAGKSTLLKCVSGLLPTPRDAVRLYGRAVGGLPPNELVEHGLVMVPEGRRLFGPMSVRENLELGAYRRRDAAENVRRMERCLSLLPDLKEKLDKPAGSLSGGQQQMVAIARALMAKPKLLLLDEPTIGLAPKVVDHIMRVVREVSREGVDILLIEQNAEVALDVADYGFVLENGAVVVHGPAQELAAKEDVRRAYMGM